MPNMFVFPGQGDSGRPARRVGAVLIAGFLLGTSLLGAAAVSAAGATPSGTGTPPAPTPPVPYLVLVPNPGTIAVSGSQTYIAESFSALNVNLGDVTPLTTFSITPDGTCTLNVCTASVSGSHTVTGTYNGATGSASLQVGIVATPSGSPTPPPPLVPPGAPTNVTAAAGDAQASVSWLAPASDGGSPIIGYTVTSSGGQSQSVDGSTTTAIVGSLTDGTSYTFTVTATNSAGPGAVSAQSFPVTPQSGAVAATTVVPPSSTGTATTDPTATGPTLATPVTMSVTVPATSGGGSVAIVTTTPPVGPPPVAGYQVLSQQIDITSTAGTNSANPLTIAFTVDESALRLQLGLLPTDAVTTDMVVISRSESGVSATVPDCVTTTLPLQLDPCVAMRQFVTINGVEAIQVTVLTGTASHWNTLVKPVPVTVRDSGYSPLLATVNQGGVVQWTFAGSRAHTVTDLLALGPSKAPWFGSTAILSGSYGHAFQAAGTYVYRSTASKDSVFFVGVVTVPIKVAPSAGTTATTFTITWSSAPISGYVFDVQSRFEKAGTTKWTAWKAWQTGASAAGGSFVPTLGAGTYDFISRIRNVSTGSVSGWSPDATVSAH